VSTDLMLLDPRILPPETADFTLDPEELRKGLEAAETYLEGLEGEAHRTAEEMLETLSTLFSNGAVQDVGFPWHQLRSHHSTAAVQILKSEGAPARIEALRCEADETRRYRQVSGSYNTKTVQRFRTTLRQVLKESQRLGHLSEEELERVIETPRLPASAKDRPKNRTLSYSEYRALTAMCEADRSASGCRDALMFCLAYLGELKPGQLVGLSLKDLGYNQRTGKVTVRVKQPKASRDKLIPLENGALIALEDWLEHRGDEDGPLLCPVRRGRIEVKRLTVSNLGEICDQRAVEAGVAPFAPADIGKSTVAELRITRRRGRGGAGTDEPEALYGVQTETPEDNTSLAKVVHFPYQSLTRNTG